VTDQKRRGQRRQFLSNSPTAKNEMSQIIDHTVTMSCRLPGVPEIQSIQLGPEKLNRKFAIGSTSRCQEFHEGLSPLDSLKITEIPVGHGGGIRLRYAESNVYTVTRSLGAAMSKWQIFLICMMVPLLWAGQSHAYSWMIRHEYTGCATCHIDPSGGYMLTAYGRAQRQTLLDTFGHGSEGDEVDRRSEFGLGLVPLPSWLNLGGSVREAYLWSKGIKPSHPPASQSLWMQADLRAAVTINRFVATGSIGYLRHGRNAAQITRGNTDVLVSREFWTGFQLGEEQDTLIRAGRMYLPFGLRVIEHPFYIRTLTDTNIDQQQQYGAAVFHQGENYRAELMGIAGNYQVFPDKYRKRGYSGYIEFAVMPRLQLGFSSLLTYARLDPTLLQSSINGAHGPMLRWSPDTKLALLVEADVVHTVIDGSISHAGFASLAQLDYELVRGLHGIASLESYLPPLSRANWFNRDWLSIAWYAYPHLDLRVDGYWSSESYSSTQRLNSIAALGQVHVSL
jgi:hypothetical protein